MLSHVRRSISLSVTQAYQSKTVEIRIMQFSPYTVHAQQYERNLHIAENYIQWARILSLTIRAYIV